MKTAISFRSRKSAIVISLFLMGILTTVTSCKKDLQSPIDQLTESATANATAAGSDTIPPTVKFTFPHAKDTVFDSITIKVKATDNVGVASVQLKIDGVIFGTKTAAPYNFGWNTKKVMNGTHQLQAIAKDAAGNVKKKSITVHTLNQGILPMEQDLINLINQDRVLHGLNALILDSRLQTAAREHSADMADHNFVTHTGSDGSTLGERLTAAGYPWTKAGECLQGGQQTAQGVYDDWVGDPARVAIFRDSNLKDIGVGCGYSGDANSLYHYFWTADLGTTQ